MWYRQQVEQGSLGFVGGPLGKCRGIRMGYKFSQRVCDRHRSLRVWEMARECSRGKFRRTSLEAGGAALVLGLQGRAGERDGGVRGQSVKSWVQAPDFSGHDKIEWPESERKGDHQSRHAPGQDGPFL